MEIAFGTVAQTYRVIGGDERPISAATYYRGMKAGLYPAPDHPSPGISRVNLTRLNASVRSDRKQVICCRRSFGSQRHWRRSHLWLGVRQSEQPAPTARASDHD